MLRGRLVDSSWGGFGAQDAFKTLPRGAKTPQDAPKTLQDAPRCPQDASKRPREVPKTPQETENGAKMEPSWHQNPPKIHTYVENAENKKTLKKQ